MCVGSEELVIWCLVVMMLEASCEGALWVEVGVCPYVIRRAMYV